jgi:hypothetical protein
VPPVDFVPPDAAVVPPVLAVVPPADWVPPVADADEPPVGCAPPACGAPPVAGEPPTEGDPPTEAEPPAAAEPPRFPTPPVTAGLPAAAVAPALEFPPTLVAVEPPTESGVPDSEPEQAERTAIEAQGSSERMRIKAFTFLELAIANGALTCRATARLRPTENAFPRPRQGREYAIHA